MIEEDWLACADPTPMLKFLEGKSRDRKLRLFACACCYKAEGFEDEDCWKLIDCAERYADGLVSDEELTSLLDQTGFLWRYDLMSRYTLGDMEEVCRIPSLCLERLAYNIYFDPYCWQCSLLRCLVGNPFRSLTLDSIWLTPTITNLATAAYEHRTMPSKELDTARLQILADALEESGCDNQKILGHLRSPGPHVRGCFPLDLLLAKE